VVPTEISGLADDIPVQIVNQSSRSYYLPVHTAVAECVVVPQEPERSVVGVNAVVSVFQKDPVKMLVGTTGDKREDGPDQRPLTWHEDFPDVLKTPVLQAPVESQHQREALRDLLYKYKDAFSLQGELGFTTTVCHRIPTNDAAPIRQAPRRLPLFSGDIADKCMREPKKDGLIKECPEDSEWASPIVLVKKKDGSWRFCIYYRAINSLSRKSSYPLPRIEDLIDGLEGANRFCSLDIRSAYYQIGIHPDDQLKTTFVVPGWATHYFERMPFGLTGAPVTFQALMDKILPIGKGGRLGKDGICFAYLQMIS